MSNNLYSNIDEIFDQEENKMNIVKKIIHAKTKSSKMMKKKNHRKKKMKIVQPMIQ